MLDKGILRLYTLTMKLFKILLLAVFLIGVLPLEAFCSDAHQEADAASHGHCDVICHTSCTHAIVPDFKVMTMPLILSVPSVFSSIDLAYQNPSLDTLKRPPVVSV